MTDTKESSLVQKCRNLLWEWMEKVCEANGVEYHGSAMIVDEDCKGIRCELTMEALLFEQVESMLATRLGEGIKRLKELGNPLHAWLTLFTSNLHERGSIGYIMIVSVPETIQSNEAVQG